MCSNKAQHGGLNMTVSYDAADSAVSIHGQSANLIAPSLRPHYLNLDLLLGYPWS